MLKPASAPGKLPAPVVLILCIFISSWAESYSITSASDGAYPWRKSTVNSASAAHNRWHYSKTSGDIQNCLGFSSVAQPGELNQADIEDEILAAMQVWNNVNNSQWSFDTASIGNIDGTSHSCFDTRHDIFWSFEEGLTLATTWTSSSSNNYQQGGADINFNTFYTWSTSGTAEVGKLDFRQILIHEFGHVLGINHSTVSSATMWPSTGSNSADHVLDADDIRAAQYLYGSQLTLLDESAPANMTIGESYIMKFTARFDGGAVTPSATGLYLNVAVVGDVDVTVFDANPAWTDVRLINPGQILDDIRQDPTVTATHKAVEAFVRNPSTFVDEDWSVWVQITPTSGSNAEVRWRAYYIDPTAEHTLASGGSYSWKTLGDLVPRVHFNVTDVVLDEQDFPVQRRVIPLSTPPPEFELNVNSTGATAVIINSNSGHGGTTNYSNMVDSGDKIVLSAPTSWGGAVFTGWDGCTSVIDTTCNLTVRGDEAVTANYNFGICGPGSFPQVHYYDDMENGATDWSHDSTIGPDTWSLEDSDANSPSFAWRSLDVSEASDQRLVSPEIALPPGVISPTLQFYTRRNLEESGMDECADGGILEYSTDTGSSWTQVDDSRLQTDPYSGPIVDGFSNPLTGLNAWCGTYGWERSVVNLTGLEGQALMFRFRLGTDNSQIADDWHIDDVKVQSCTPELIFEDGME